MPQYEDYAKLIKNEAWRRVKKQPYLDFEELVSQGNLAFCLALKTWDETKGKFSTYLWWKIRDQMQNRNLILPEEKINPSDDHAEDKLIREFIDEKSPIQDRTLAFKMGLVALGKEAKEICSIILNSSGEFCDFTARQSIQVTQVNIKRYFLSLNWSNEKINFALAEIKAMLKSL